jgi:hypothetical protein
MASVSGRAWSSRDMPHFLPWLCQPAVDAVIIQAQSMFQARMTAVVRRFVPGVPFGEGLEVSDKMMTIDPTGADRQELSGDEASQLILRLVDGRGRPRQ